MRRLLGSVSTLALALLPANGWGASLPQSVVVQSGGSFTCPYTVTGNDPCASAPAPATAYWRQSNFFAPGGYANTNAATTANYSASRPAFNVPGVDYAIGPTTPLTSHFDPAVSTPPGCSYSTTTSGTSAGELTCGGSQFNGTVAHVNLGPVGGHGCTSLRLNAGATGVSNYVIDDAYGFNDSGLCSVSAALGTWIQFTSGVVPLTISNSYFDGNWITWRTAGTPTCAKCSPSAMWGLGGLKGLVTVKYSVINHFAGRTLSSGSGAGFGFEMIGSWVEGYCSSVLNGHCEWSVGPSSGGVIDHGFILSYNVLMQDWQGTNFGPMPIFLAANYPVTYSAPAGQPAIGIDHNVMINAFIGGATSNAGAVVDLCVGATVSATGVCSGAGPYIFEIARHPNALGVTEAFFPNSIFNCNTPGYNGGFAAVTKVSDGGPGYLSQWTYDAGSTFAPNGTYGPAQCAKKTREYHAVGSYGVTGFGGVFGPIVIQNNYMDVSSAYGYPRAPSLYQLAGASHSMGKGITASISGTTLTTSASVTINKGEYVYAPDLCSPSNYTLCPEITASATGTSFQVTAGFSTTAPEAMTVVDPTICSQPIAFSGNVDMVGLAEPAWMNKPSRPKTNFVIGCY